MCQDNRKTSEESLFRVLQVFGVPLDRPEDVPGMLRKPQGPLAASARTGSGGLGREARIPLRLTATALAGGFEPR